METRRAAISLMRCLEGYCWPTGEAPAVTWEIALSRIWEALRQAEKQRSRTEERAPAADRLQGDADRRDRNVKTACHC